MLGPTPFCQGGDSITSIGRLFDLVSGVGTGSVRFCRCREEEPLCEEIEVGFPFRRVVAVVVHMPNVGHVLLFEIFMHPLADVDQAVTPAT